MESLSFIYLALAHENPTPTPKLRTVEELSWVVSSSVWLNWVGTALFLSILKTATDGIVAPVSMAQSANGNLVNTAVVQTRYGVGVHTRTRPGGTVVGGRLEGTRVFLTGAQADAAGYRWAQLTDGTWAATPYLVSSNTSGYTPVSQGWNTNVGYGSTAIVRTRYGVGVNTRARPGGGIVGGRIEGARVVLSGAQADAGGFRWAQLTNGTWVAAPYLVLDRVVSSGNVPVNTQPEPAPPPPQGVTQRITFAQRETSARISGGVARGTRNTYLLRAQQNQTLSVSINSVENNAVFDVVAPNGTTLVEGTAYWQGTLPATGDYRIVIGSIRGGASYNMDVAVSPSDATPPQGFTERITFAQGATSAQVSDDVTQGVRNTYLLRAQQNQTLSVDLASSGGNAVFDVIGPNGRTLAQQTGDWQGTLPANGDYRIVVRSLQGRANYTLTVGTAQSAPPQGFTERLEFAPGETSIRVSDQVVQDTRNIYLLRAQRNQSMSLNLNSTGNRAVFDVVGPNGNTLVQGTEVWEETLPANGDYRIVIRPIRGSANYTLQAAVSGTQPSPPSPQGLTQRIQVPSGALSTNVEGSVVLGTRNTYLLRTQRGQTLSFNLDATEGNAVFDVVAPNGVTVAQGTDFWNGTSNANGDYRIIVGSTRGNANYNLNVAVGGSQPSPPPVREATERIEVPSGALSTNVSGNVTAGRGNTYLLNTQRNQIISVNLDSSGNNAVLEVVDPKGETVARDTEFWNGVSSSDGDYRIIVKSKQGNASYSFLVSAAQLD